MNLLGKTLVVFTALASIGLMIMAIGVYSTHTNWQQEATDLKNQLAEAQKRQRATQEQLSDQD